MNFLLVFFAGICIAISGYTHNSPELFRQFPNKYFIETGTAGGEGIETALGVECFEKIHSIEILKVFFDIAYEKFKDHKNVTLWHGDSGELLRQVLKKVDAPATFWLDGHISCIPGKKSSPIMEELEAIKRHPIKTHTILIDDVRDFGSGYFDYVPESKIRKKLLEINPDYKIEYRDCLIANDVLVAIPPK